MDAAYPSTSHPGLTWATADLTKVPGAGSPLQGERVTCMHCSAFPALLNGTANAWAACLLLLHLLASKVCICSSALHAPQHAAG
jgi:hypothetical protein